MIRAIAAIDARYGIARAGSEPYTIPWNIPLDQQYFKEQTANSIVVMGRETYEKFEQPLPDRRNVVVSRTLNTVRQGFELIDDVDAFLQVTNDDVWIIGGAGLYSSTLQYCSELYITHIDGDFKCDRFFPHFSQDFNLMRESEPQTQNGHTFRFAVYIKNR